MTPPVQSSVRQVHPSKWTLGRSMVCEESVEPVANAVATWSSDQAGHAFYLRPMSADECVGGLPDKGDEQHRIHLAGSCAAVWRLGGVYVKVKSWRQGLQLEPRTIEFARPLARPVALPEVVHAWTDEPWNRTFTLLKAVRGQTLDDAWDDLSQPQRDNIASEVADLCVRLSRATSKCMQTIDGDGPHVFALGPKYPWETWPSWVPWTIGPLSADQIAKYGFAAKHGADLHFCHPDLGPTNIMVADGRLAAVIDWEAAAFFPRFFIRTTIHKAGGFFLKYVEGKSDDDCAMWALSLSAQLGERGFAKDLEALEDWNRRMIENEL